MPTYQFNKVCIQISLLFPHISEHLDGFIWNYRSAMHKFFVFAWDAAPHSALEMSRKFWVNGFTQKICITGVSIQQIVSE